MKRTLPVWKVQGEPESLELECDDESVNVCRLQPLWQRPCPPDLVAVPADIFNVIGRGAPDLRTYVALSKTCKTLYQSIGGVVAVMQQALDHQPDSKWAIPYGAFTPCSLFDLVPAALETAWRAHATPEFIFPHSKAMQALCRNLLDRTHSDTLLSSDDRDEIRQLERVSVIAGGVCRSAMMRFLRDHGVTSRQYLVPLANLRADIGDTDIWFDGRHAKTSQMCLVHTVAAISANNHLGDPITKTQNGQSSSITLQLKNGTLPSYATTPDHQATPPLLDSIQFLLCSPTGGRCTKKLPMRPLSDIILKFCDTSTQWALCGPWWDSTLSHLITTPAALYTMISGVCLPVYLQEGLRLHICDRAISREAERPSPITHGKNPNFCACTPSIIYRQLRTRQLGYSVPLIGLEAMELNGVVLRTYLTEEQYRADPTFEEWLLLYLYHGCSIGRKPSEWPERLRYGDLDYVLPPIYLSAIAYNSLTAEEGWEPLPDL